MGDPVRARGIQNYFKHEVAALGIVTPALRTFVRERVGRVRGSWGVGEAISFCERMLQEDEMELRGVGIMVLSAFERQLEPAFLRVANRWLRTRLDNWAFVDGFCGGVLSPMLERLPTEVERALWEWAGAKGLWLRRASLVALVPSARHGKRLDLCYALAREHLSAPEDLMHKATGWLLREAGRTDRPRLKEFLLKHGPTIPRTALRYAIEHFPQPERLSLLAATKPRATPAR